MITRLKIIIKVKRKCWVYGGTNHIDRDCFFRKGQNKKMSKGHMPSKLQANVMTVGATSDCSATRYLAGSPKLNSMFNSNDWWIDSKDNVHICANKNLFSSY